MTVSERQCMSCGSYYSEAVGYKRKVNVHIWRDVKQQRVFVSGYICDTCWRLLARRFGLNDDRCHC